MSSRRAASAVMRATSAGGRLDELAGDPKPPRGKRPRRHGNRAGGGEFTPGRRGKVDSERRRARRLRHVHAHERPPGLPVVARRKGQRTFKRRPLGVVGAFGSVDDDFEYAPRLWRAAADGDAERRWRLRERKARSQQSERERETNRGTHGAVAQCIGACGLAPAWPRPQEAGDDGTARGAMDAHGGAARGRCLDASRRGGRRRHAVSREPAHHAPVVADRRRQRERSRR